jgi:uncharacterized protein YcbK (DUF882 family)
VRHFNREEFLCPCCLTEDMDPAFLARLDDAREIAGVPFVITSGFRCRKHNAKIGGVEDSAHVWGVAADIAAASTSRRFHILRGLMLAGFRRIGLSVEDGFVHVDQDEDKPQDVIWGY